MVFVAIGIVTLNLGLLTIPGHQFVPSRTTFLNSGEALMAILAAGGLMAIGFLVTVISEGFVLARFGISGRQMIRTLLLMNGVSYSLLLALSAPIIWTAIQKKEWFFHR